MITITDAAVEQLKEITATKANPEKVMLRIEISGFG